METFRDIIIKFLTSRITSPGVYQFINKDKEIIYIGKAKNLTKRINSYLRPDTPKTKILVQNMCDLRVFETKSEYEALILEASLIKKFKPKYNILLKDDKSFPYIIIDESSNFSKIIKYRGKDLKDKIYYGPFPYGRELNKSIELLQKIFLLRSCSDAFFKNRTKPCLLYQIKQCSAPCVGKISAEKYNQLVLQVKNFLKGNNQSLYEDLFLEMNKASEEQNYEMAARYRDRIKTLSQLKDHRNLLLVEIEDTDVICLDKFMDQIIIQISFIRLGAITGHKVMVVDSLYDSLEEVLNVFISSFYLENFMPNEILTSVNINSGERSDIENLLYQMHNKKAKIVFPKGGNKQKLLKYCLSILEDAKNHKFHSSNKHKFFIAELEKILGMNVPIKKIEVFDNSHCFGSYAVGAIIASDSEGFKKSEYRRYNIKSAKKSDDYSMLSEVLARRFAERNKYDLPDLIIVDGGIVHLKIIVDFLALNNIKNITVISVAKGKDRNSGNEMIYRTEGTIMLDKTNKLKHYIQILRDEAHRFAISGYRKRALSSTDNSILDNIPGIGKIRKQKLLTSFGSVKNLKSASLDDIENITGIDKKMSKVIYQYLNKE